MIETLSHAESPKTPEKNKGIIAQAKEKINSLLTEMKGKMQKNDKKPEEPKEDKDDGFDPNNLPKYIQDIDNGIDPN